MANSRNSGFADLLLDATAACLRHHLQKGQTLAVALSGGRDSVALLHALHAMQSEISYTLRACHVNHHLSPNADAWESFCRDLCNENGIPLDVFHVDVPRNCGTGLEAAARKVRYQALIQTSADWLAFAHHRGDQAETLLFNLLRGAGLRGAAAMQETRTLRPGLQLIRPLLGVSRAIVEAYLKRHGLSWIDDESNTDTELSRNFLRREILPVLSERFPAAEASLAGAAERFGEAETLLGELAMADLAGNPPKFPLPLACFAQISEPRGRNLLRFMLGRYDVQIPSEEKLGEALRQLLTAKPDRHPEISFGEFCLCRKRDKVCLDQRSHA